MRDAGTTLSFGSSKVQATTLRNTPAAHQIAQPPATGASTHGSGFWGNVSWQRFNGLEVTGLVAKRFLSLPYGIVSAHSRHLNLHM